MLFFTPIYLPGIGNKKNLAPKSISKIFIENLHNFKKNKKFTTKCIANSWNSINPNLKKSYKFNIDESVEKSIVKLQLAENPDSFYDFCFINREYLNYCFLYRLTAFKLRAETDSKISKQTNKIEKFRKKILNNISFIDQPVSQGLILGEKRIKEILQGSLTENDILEKIGEDNTSVSCFWVVLNAALSAWEKKGNSEITKSHSETYAKLKQIKKIFFQSTKHQKMLIIEFKYIDAVFFEKKNSDENFKHETDTIEGLRLLVSQLEKLPSNSYAPLLEKIITTSDGILQKKFGLVAKNLNNFRIKFPLSKIETNSRLIEIQKNDYS